MGRLIRRMQEVAEASAANSSRTERVRVKAYNPETNIYTVVFSGVEVDVPNLGSTTARVGESVTLMLHGVRAVGASG